MKTWEDFTPYILPYVPGCPDKVAENFAHLAMIELCKEAHVWRKSLPMSVVANNARYLPATVCLEEIVNVKGVAFEGDDLLPTNESLLDSRSQTWRTHTGDVTHYLMEDSKTLRLYRIPTQDSPNGLSVRAAVAPKMTTTGVDDNLWEEHLLTVADGALARLMAMADKPWASSSWEVHQVKFDEAIAGLRIDVLRSYTNAPLQVQGRSFI